MRIGINFFDLLPGQGRGAGAETYALQLVRHLASLDRVHQYVLFVNQQNQEWFGPLPPNFSRHRVGFDSRRKWTRACWEQFQLPVVARRLRLDVLHSPFNTSPLIHPCAAVVTLHDLVNFFYRERFPAVDTVKMKYQRWLLKRALPRAARVMAVSEFTRQEAVRHLKLNPAQVTVVHLAAGENALPPSRNLVEDFVLAVASDSPHKNLAGLIPSFAQAVRETGTRTRLVLAGMIREKPTPPAVGAVDLRALARRHGVDQQVEVRGFVSALELETLYQRCRFLVIPSLYEGFGLPVLEAMTRGVPVVCARSGPLPEVAGEAALWFDPNSAADMAATLRQALGSPQLLDALVARGRTRARLFSWERTAQATLAVYQAARATVPVEGNQHEG
jgi:alpha-1,3-rhamnosyl/mannosyltransferase